VKRGLFIVSELDGPVAERVREIQREFDPRLAHATPPHVTITGSSGAGPILPSTTVEELRAALEPVARATAPIAVTFEPPHRFMQTGIVVLPLDPHGPLRALHERIATSGLTFGRSRFPFSPHCTLNFYRTLTPAELKRLLALRVDDPVVLARIQVYESLDPQPARKVLELKLEGRGTREEGRGHPPGRS
jgi:2'-5' RNA ligase